MMHSFSRISVGDSEIILRPPTFSTGVLTFSFPFLFFSSWNLPPVKTTFRVKIDDGLIQVSFTCPSQCGGDERKLAGVP